MKKEIMAYVRPDGQVGVRNLLLVIPTVVCSAQVCQRIAEEIPGAVAIPHPHGCSQVGEDAVRTLEILAAMGRNPNVGAVLAVALGCETVQISELVEKIAPSGKPVEMIGIQQQGGSVRTIEEGVRRGRQLAAHLLAARREPVPAAKLVLGLHSLDAGPGQEEANRALGTLAARHVASGGTAAVAAAAALALAGAPVGAPGAAAPTVQRRVEALEAGPYLPGDASAPAPVDRLRRAGEVARPLLGDRSPDGVLGTGERPPAPGLYLVDTPAAPSAALTALAAVGAQVLLASTGTGRVLGSAVAPVVTVTANRDLPRDLQADLDLVWEGEEAPLADLVARAAEGHLTSAELLGHQEFAIERIFLSL